MHIVEEERDRRRERSYEKLVGRSTDPNLAAERSIHDLKFSLNWMSMAENFCLH